MYKIQNTSSKCLQCKLQSKVALHGLVQRLHVRTNKLYLNVSSGNTSQGGPPWSFAPIAHTYKRSITVWYRAYILRGMITQLVLLITLCSRILEVSICVLKRAYD